MSRNFVADLLALLHVFCDPLFQFAVTISQAPRPDFGDVVKLSDHGSNVNAVLGESSQAINHRLDWRGATRAVSSWLLGLDQGLEIVMTVRAVQTGVNVAVTIARKRVQNQINHSFYRLGVMAVVHTGLVNMKAVLVMERLVALRARKLVAVYAAVLFVRHQDRPIVNASVVHTQALPISKGRVIAFRALQFSWRSAPGQRSCAHLVVSFICD
jgi:hypothetical protein